MKGLGSFLLVGAVSGTMFFVAAFLVLSLFRAVGDPLTGVWSDALVGLAVGAAIGVVLWFLRSRSN